MSCEDAHGDGDEHGDCDWTVWRWDVLRHGWMGWIQNTRG